MRIKLTLNLQSPLMVGGNTLINSYKESKDHIPGDVLRAAYARTITDRCPYGTETIEVNGQAKRYWVHYRDREECPSCPYQNLCAEFSAIRFLPLYPLDGKPYPATAYECKYGNDSCPPVVDVLRYRLKNGYQPKGCGCCGSSYETAKGIHCDGHKVSLKMQMLTKTAVDIRRRTARQAMLYSMNAVSPTWFSGILEMSSTLYNEFRKIDTLRIGASITRGFGKCTVETKEDETVDLPLSDRIKRFNGGLGSSWLAVDLLSDVYLGLETFQHDSSVSDDMYRGFLENRIGLPESFALRYVYKDQESVRGYDTSGEAEREMLRPARLVIRAGAVFVYEGQTEIALHLLEKLEALEKTGVGDETQNGYGRVRVCDEFHMRFDALVKGEKI